LVSELPEPATRTSRTVAGSNAMGYGPPLTESRLRIFNFAKSFASRSATINDPWISAMSLVPFGVIGFRYCANDTAGTVGPIHHGPVAARLRPKGGGHLLYNSRPASRLS